MAKPRDIDGGKKPPHKTTKYLQLGDSAIAHKCQGEGNCTGRKQKCEDHKTNSCAGCAGNDIVCFRKTGMICGKDAI